jgi:hypothetical protein
VLKDSNGIPAPRITYRLSENSRRMQDHTVERGSEIRRGSATGGKRPSRGCENEGLRKADGRAMPKPQPGSNEPGWQPRLRLQ